MNADIFIKEFDLLAETPNGVQKLREMILQLAVRGKLVPQDPNDEPAAELLKRIATEKQRLIKQGKIKNQKVLPPVDPSEIPSELPRNWECVRLGELAFSFQNGLSKRTGSSGVDTVVLRLADIVEGRVSSNAFRKIQLSEDEFERYTVKACDILVTRVNGSIDLVGSFNLVRSTCGHCYCDHFVRIRLFHRLLDMAYLELFGRSRTCRDQIEAKFITTAGQKTVNQKHLCSLVVPLPPLPEQKRIVARVDELMRLCDDLEARQQEQKEKQSKLNASCLHALTSPAVEDSRPLASIRGPSPAWNRIRDHFDLLYDNPDNVAELRNAILQLAVQGRLVPQNPNDEPAITISKLKAAKQNFSANGRRIRKPVHCDPELLDIHFPDSWNIAAFDDVADIQGGVTKGRKLSNRETVSLPYLRVANVQRGSVDLEYMKEIEVPIEEVTKYKLHRGDLLITEGGDWDKVGRTAIWEGQIEPCLHQNHVFRARLPDGHVERSWLMMYLNSALGRKYFANASKQTTNLASINMTQLRSCPVPLPPLPEQKRIVGKVDKLMRLCDRLEENLQTSQTQAETLAAAIAQSVGNEMVSIEDNKS